MIQEVIDEITRSIEAVTKRVRKLEIQEGAVSSSLGGTTGNYILLYDLVNNNVFAYEKNAAGFTLALAAAVAGDVIWIPPAVIAGNYTILAGIMIIGMGRATEFTGTIQNEGIMKDVHVSGRYDGVQAGPDGYGYGITTGSYDYITGVFAVEGLGYEGAFSGGGVYNQVFGEYSTVCGGTGNTVNWMNDSPETFKYNFMGGGYYNSIEDGYGYSAWYSVVVGGSDNFVYTYWGSIGGGYSNDIDIKCRYGTISGGNRNLLDSDTPWLLNNWYNTIGGGSQNVIHEGYSGVIAGGDSNAMQGNEITPASIEYSAICGGWGNYIEESNSCFIGGGEGHEIENGSEASGILSGSYHIIFRSIYSVVCGGQANFINADEEPADFKWNFIGGGLANYIEAELNGSICGATLVGGYGNEIEADWGFLGGGYGNSIDFYCDYSTLCGGMQNMIREVNFPASSFLSYNSIVGGWSHEIRDSYAGFIGGGVTNDIQGSLTYGEVYYNTIGGGAGNSIEEVDSATISGGESNAIDTGGEVAFIPGGLDACADKYGQEAVAAGGFWGSGEAQRCHYITRRSIVHSDANWYQLYLDGAALQMTINTDTVWTFTVQIVGTTQGCTKSFGFKINGVIENDGGTTTMLASNVTTIYDADDVSFDARVTADNVNDALLVEVTDSDGTGDTVRWVADIRTAEVTYPA